MSLQTFLSSLMTSLILQSKFDMTQFPRYPETPEMWEKTPYKWIYRKKRTSRRYLVTAQICTRIQVPIGLMFLFPSASQSLPKKFGITKNGATHKCGHNVQWHIRSVLRLWKLKVYTVGKQHLAMRTHNTMISSQISTSPQPQWLHFRRITNWTIWNH